MLPQRILPALLVSFTALARAQTGEYFSVPPVDAPQLAARGSYGVGVRTLHLVHARQIDILHFDRSTGKAPLYDRPLTVEIWYPAMIPPGVAERTVYSASSFSSPNDPAHPAPSFEIAGKALRDAEPVKSGPFPLVVVSHGYPGSRTFLSYLTENLASKGYVVAAIDHTDSVAGAVRDFSSTLLNRAADQLFTLGALTAPSSPAADFLGGILDKSKAAIIGYSMGGYGAIASAGAGYSKESLGAKFVPGGYLDDWLAGSPKFAALTRNNLKAVIAIAPWGEEPPINSWDADALSAIRIPTFFIVGDQDDVSGYDPGVRQIFDGAIHSERCMLVYENARHNVGGNPAPPGVPLDFSGRESFEEPVWRKDRITAINQHFIAAFLDLYLKGDASRMSFLHVSPEKSNNGLWPLAQGASVGAAFAGDDLKYWKGFERRWAVGLEMHCVAPQQ